MMQKAGIMAIGLILVSSTVAADSALDGSQAEPELVDDSGDVAYDNLFFGSQDHDYLDITKAWIEHEPVIDNLSFTLMNVDGRTLEQVPNDYSIQCEFSGEVWTVEDLAGTLAFKWFYERYTTGGGFARSTATWLPVGSEGSPTPSEKEVPVRHEFTLGTDTPGTFAWSTGRAGIALLGDELRSQSANCREQYGPAGQDLASNWDRASALSVYSFSSLRRLVGPDGSPDPLENTDGMSGSVSPSVSNEPGESSGPGLVLVLVAMMALVGWRAGRCSR